MKKTKSLSAIVIVTMAAIGIAFFNFNYKVNARTLKVNSPQKFSNINIGTIQDSADGDVIDLWGSGGVVTEAFIYNTTTLTDGAAVYSLIGGTYTSLGSGAYSVTNVKYKVTSTSGLRVYTGNTTFY